MTNTLRYIYIILFLTLAISSYSQNYTITEKTLTSDEGLIGNRITSVFQDSDKYIWLISQNGLGRYDGHQYKWFNKSNSSFRDIPKNNQFAEDSEGYIWFNINNTIDLIHKNTLEVISFEERFKDVDFSNLSISNIKQGPNQSVCFIAKTGKETKTYLYHSSTGLVHLDFLKEKVYDVFLKKDHIWLRRKDTWQEYHIETGKLLQSFEQKEADKWLFIKDEDNNYFAHIEQNELVIHIAKNNELKEYCRFPNFTTDASKFYLYYDSQHKVLITKKRQQQYFLDLNKKELKPFKHSRKDNKPFTKLFLTDHRGIIWGAKGQEISLAKITTAKFTQYPPYIPARGIWVNDEYLLSRENRVSLAPPNNTLSSKLRLGLSTETNIKDEFWMGNSQGIAQYSLEDLSRIKQINFAAKKKLSNVQTVPWSILRDKEGRWWAGTRSNRGLYVTTKENPDSLQSYEQYNDFDVLEKLMTTHLVEDGKYVWAVSNTGLFLIHKKKGVQQRYISNAEQPYRLPISNGHFLYKEKSTGKNGVYWLATNADGLVRFELNSNWEVVKYQTFTTADGLSSNVLYAIIEDDEKRLWVSSLNGLTCLNLKNFEIQTFFEEDGLPITEFNRISYAKGGDGRIYFGTLGGVTGFHPDEIIKEKPYDATISVTKFEKYQKQGTKLTDETALLEQHPKIVLQPTDRLFRLSVSMKDFFNSGKLRYHYKIEGLFNDFQLMDGNTIEIGGLRYGKYRLILKGQGADRRFSTQELVIPVIVVRPFYLRWWFILLAIIVSIISATQFYFWRIRHLQDRKNELELFVKERTIQLQELDKVKSKFFANISHELRTPLTLILAPLNHLFDISQLTNKQHTQLQIMQRNGQKLLKRINELLDLSRLDANKLKVEEHPIFLYPFLKTLLSTFESTANLKNIKLLFEYQLDEEKQVLIDEDKIEKIISNYLSNALKFTPKEGTISLKISKQQNNIQMSVSDTGMGILDTDLIKIFDRFYQTERNNQSQGTGIGLSLSQELAKVLKGRVWATSQVGTGSTFFLEFPLIETFVQKGENSNIPTETLKEATAESPITPLSIPNYQNNRPTILIVEDNPDLRTYLTLILEDDYQIITAENGQEALEQLEAPHERSCELIISDIMMPVMDGIKLLTQLKASDEWRHIPVIMLTARQSLEVKIETLRIGVDDYLIKPFKDEELKARIANLITNSRNRLTATPPKQEQIKTQISAADLKWIGEIENLLLEKIEDPNFKLSDLAIPLMLSYSQIQRKIKKITGLSPKQYERSIKLAKARRLLRSGDFKTVSEVTYRLGFENHYYFSKIYKKTYGIMPSKELKGR